MLRARDAGDDSPQADEADQEEDAMPLGLNVFDRRKEVPNYFANMTIGQMENKIFDQAQEIKDLKERLASFENGKED